MSDVALEFLSNFPGLQIFVAADERENNPPWHFHCSYEEALPKLQERQQFNWGVYFTVNELDRSLDPDRKRTKRMLKSIRSVYCEFDGGPSEPIPEWPIKPSIVVQTSPGKYHFYWLTKTDKIKEWDGVQQRIVNDYGGDKQAKDVTRFLRIPDFLHCKKDPPHLVKLLENNGHVYDWEAIKVAFPPTDKAVKPTDKVNVDASAPDGLTYGKSIKEHDEDIIYGRHFHGPVLAHLQRLKDGDPPYLIKSHLKSMFELAKHFQDQWEKSESEWQHAYSTIDYQVDEYVNILSPKVGKPVRNIYTNEIPGFPKDLMHDWPEPWPMIWDNFKRLPRTLDECLLVPTVICIHSFLLNSVYVTEWGKRPNMAFLNIAPSTGNKDVNSENVIRSVLEILVHKGKLSMPFTKMITGAEGISSDTAFLQSFQEQDLFWLNTEATYLFQQMAQATYSNSSVKSLESKIIDVVDGGAIRGKRKAGKEGDIKGIDDPNAQVLLYAQPETISAYIKENMVDSGLLGRMILHIPVPSEEDPFLDSFKRRTDKQNDLDDDLIDLYAKLDAKSLEKKFLKPTDSDLDKLQDWMLENVKPMSETDHSIKMLKRLAISAEQLYVVILGVCQKWDEMKGRKPRDHIDVECMFSILDYWAKCKVYVLREYIDQKVDPLADSVVEIVAGLINRDIKQPENDVEFAERYNVTRRANVYRVIKNRPRLMSELAARGDLREVRRKVNQIIDMLIKEGALIETTNKSTTYIGFGPNYQDDD